MKQAAISPMNMHQQVMRTLTTGCGALAEGVNGRHRMVVVHKNSFSPCLVHVHWKKVVWSRTEPKMDLDDQNAHHIDSYRRTQASCRTSHPTSRKESSRSV
eukprot:4488250-Amphidinium_carterae.1